jgi:hypothetical protein
LSLVESDLLPLIQSRASNPVIYVTLEGGRSMVLDWKPAMVESYLSTTEPRYLAGQFARHGGKSRLISIPDGTDVVAWAAAALSVWRDVDADRFPSGPDWRRERDWQTPDEQSAARTLLDLEGEAMRLTAELQHREGAATADLLKAQELGDAGPRRLLTEQGASLVNAVIDALGALGFNVKDMDEIHPPNDRLEDLRVSDPGDGNWEAIVEVRGYNSGAKVSDLLRIQGRFVPRYVAAEKKLPSASWYIANQFLKRSPAERPPILDTNPEELHVFAESGGLAVDTRDLFLLAAAAERGDVTPEESRQLLINATGRFTFPLQTEPTAD